MRGYIFFIVILLVSCNTKVNESKSNEKEFEMYEMTEMALLMEKMFHENESLKSKIINQENLGKFPDTYQTIFTANMTDKAENDDFFKEHAKLFIESQENIYKEKGKEKENFNLMVNACVKCHEVKCTGPIVRIKKLYIK
ncbi:MAG: hypothetical protein ACOVQ2_00965 [Flavobacterium sp.]|jgi:hypothetical protein